MRIVTRLWFAAVGLLITSSALCSIALTSQETPEVPTLKSGEIADVLLVGRVPAPGEKDEHGKPALANMEPVAFFVSGKLRGCFANHPASPDDAVPKATIDNLNRIYRPAQQFPLWFAGAPWGDAVAVKSCIDSDYESLGGCFRTHPAASARARVGGFSATLWTGATATSSHPPVHRIASTNQRLIFLTAAAKIFAAHNVRIAPQSIHTTPILETQFRLGRTALVGSTLVQLASKQPKTWYSYRLFLVIEQDGSGFVPVLERFHRTTILLDDSMSPPKPGQLLDEDAQVDREEFLDSFPLFAGEPDAIITQHSYYESWSFSLYRRVGDRYRLLSTACGGGV